MKRLLFFICFIFLLSFNLFSQEGVIGFGAGVNNYNGYQIDLDVGYHYNNYLQAFITARLQDMEHFGGGYNSDSKAVKPWTVDDSEFFNILLIPSLNFSIPFVRKKNACWSFNINPGIMIQPLSRDYLDVKYEASDKGNNMTTIHTKKVSGDSSIARVYWNNKLAVQYKADEITIFGGLELSNQDVYSKRRSIKIDGISIESHLPAKKDFCNSIFAGIRFDI